MIVGTLLVCLVISTHAEVDDNADDNSVDNEQAGYGHKAGGTEAVNTSFVMMDGATLSTGGGDLNYNPDSAALTTNLFEIHDKMINKLVETYTELAAVLGDPDANHEKTFWGEQSEENRNKRIIAGYGAITDAEKREAVLAKIKEDKERLAALEAKQAAQAAVDKAQAESCVGSNGFVTELGCNAKKTCSWNVNASVNTECREKTCTDHSEDDCNGKQWDTTKKAMGAKCVWTPAAGTCSLAQYTTQSNCEDASETWTESTPATCSTETQRRRLGAMPHLQALIVN